MVCRIEDLKDKEVICVSDGSRIGYVSDVELDCQSARINAIIVYGKQKFFGLFGREDDYTISWENISVIGEDTILVNFKPRYTKKKANGILSTFFEIK